MRIVLVSAILFCLYGCTTFEASMERCTRYSSDLVDACQQSVRDTGAHQCFHKYYVRTSDPEGYRRCAGKPLYTEQQIFCMDHIKSGDFKDQSECDEYQKNPSAWQCRDAQDKEKCAWALEHPVEAECERSAEKHGGYWECVKIGHERADRQETLGVQQRQVDADITYQQQQLKLQEQQAQRERRQQTGDAIRAAGEAFKPKPSVTCTSRPKHGGQVETRCE